MDDTLIAASALREALAENILAAAEIAEGNKQTGLAKALGALAAEAKCAPPSRILTLADDVAARIEELRAGLRS